MILSIFSCVCEPSVCLLWRNVCLVLWPIFWLGHLFFFEISSLSVASFAIIFTHSEGCLFTLLIVSFVVQKLLSLIRSHLFISAFISITVGDDRGSCCDLCQRVFCLCFPLGVLWFLILHLDLYSILSLFLCMVLESVLVSFFYKWLTTFTSTTC